jgi:hypothetical protein
MTNEAKQTEGVFTFTDIHGNEVTITEENLAKKGMFFLSENTSALLVEDKASEESSSITTQLIVPKPDNEHDPAPLSSLVITAVSLHLKDKEYVKGLLNYLVGEVNKLREGREETKEETKGEK